MMKNIAGALLVGLTVLTFTPTVFAGQAAQAGQARQFVGAITSQRLTTVQET